MKRYTVTTELNTSFCTKVLRFLKLKKKLLEFNLIVRGYFKKGDILQELNSKLLIVKVSDYDPPKRNTDYVHKFQTGC